MLVGGNGSREKRLEAIDRVFERSFNPRAAFSGVVTGQDFVVQPPRIWAMVPCLEQLYAGFRLKLCQIKMPSKTDISHPNAA